MRKSALLIGCAAGALLAAQSAPASAQSFQGTPTVVTGAANVTNGASTTSVVVLTPETVINWAAEDFSASGAIDFQPIGTTATFATTPTITDYTVLNRILPVDGSGIPVVATVSFNGTVNSVIVNNPGGHIWFYSPTGIIAGPNARFNVGSLILTTNDIAFVPNPAGGFGSIYGPGGLVNFNGPAGSTGFVRVDNGAQITASGANAYVALVAPRVVQQGLVQANGQIAYVAAEQLDMTISGGLFDFTVTVGTTDSQGIVHTGTTTGPASTTAADLQQISMVAVPKNTALTMLLAGSAGYTPAANVANEGSSVVLTAGFENDTPSALPANRLGSIDIRDGTYSNDLTAWATSGITIAPNSADITFGGQVAINAAETIRVDAGPREQITAAGNMFLRAGVSGTGGSVSLTGFTTDGQPGGLIDVTGDVIINATSEGVLSSAPPPDGQGGDVSILADGGTIATQSLFVDAYGFGQFNTEVGGDGTGGQVSVIATNDGTIAADFLGLNAYGAGGNSDSDGGDGTGGGVVLTAFDGVLDFDFVSIDAGGQGGSGPSQHGDGLGGTAQVLVTSRPQDWDELVVRADATAGYDPEIGGGSSGNATASPSAILFEVADNGSLIVRGGVALTANAYMNVDGVAGFTGRAGDIGLTVSDFGSLTVEGTLSAEASALLVNTVDTSPNSSPTQTGGSVSITADGGALTTGHLEALAHAYGLPGSIAAGSATGGMVSLSALNGGSVTIDNGVAGEASAILWANGYGAPGPIASDAFGGTVLLLAEGGSISVNGELDLAASGFTEQIGTLSANGMGFNATGGTATVDMVAGSPGTNSISASGLSISAAGDARFAPTFGNEVLIAGNGGDGTGGTAQLTVGAGTLLLDRLGIASVGTGGKSAASASAIAFQSGDGAGGTAELVVGNGSVTVGMLDLTSNGYGGGGGPAAIGTELAAQAGAGTGGNASVRLLGGSLSATEWVIYATGLGGNGMAHDGAGDGGNGGSAIGGSALLQAPAGWAGSLSTDFLTLQGSGLAGFGGASAGGANGAGGNGTGFRALVDLSDGAFAIGGMSINAWAEAAGGEGTGGEARFTLIDSVGPVGARSIGGLYINASGFGPGGDTTLQSEAGSAALTLHPMNAASAIDLTGELGISSLGSSAPAGAGIDVDLSGAPLTVDGQVLMYTSRDLSIGADQLLQGLGDVILEARAIDSTSPIAAGLSLQATASGGDIVTGDLAAGTWLYVDAAGSATLGNLAAAIDAAATTRTGNLTLGNVSAGDEIWLSVFGTDPASVLTAGNLVTTGLGNDAAAGPPVLFGGYPGGAGPTGNVTRVRSAGSLAIGTITSPGRAILVADRGTTTAGTLTADEALIVLGRGNIAIAGQATDGMFYVADSAMFALLPEAYDPSSLNGLDPVRTGGALIMPGAVNAGSVTIGVGGDATLATVNSGGVTVLSSGGAIDVDQLSSTGAVTARGRSVDIVSSGGLTFAEASATGGNVAIQANGPLTLQVVSASNLADLRARGTLHTVGDVTAASIDMSATADILADAGLLATGTLSANALGTFTLAGQARGTVITIASGDIALGPGARLGARGLTTDLTLLNANVAAVMTIGGASQTGITPQGVIPPPTSGYRLDQAEATRLFADNSITFGLSGYRAEPGYGRIAIRDLALTFGATGNLGTGGQIEVSTPAEIAITGNVALTTSGADDTLLIDPTLVELDSSTGSIALLGASGAPLGRLEILGDTIAVASTGALTQLRTLTDFAAINALLDTPGGTGMPVRAGTVTVTADDAFYVQNSGASSGFTDRRGFAAGGLDITTATPATRIAINGQIVTAGGPVGGLDTAPLIRINGAAPAAGGRFDPSSTINGCAIGASCAVPPPDDRPDIPPPPSDSDLLQPSPPDASPPSLFVAPIIELADSDPLVEPPLVDEPITGIGNDDLWEPPCPDTSDDGACREAGEQP